MGVWTAGCNLHQPGTLAGKVAGKVEGLLSRIDLVGLGMRLESLPSAHHPLGAVDFHEQHGERGWAEARAL